MTDGREVRAWFTPRIEVSAGPGVYYGLPGLVLAVEMQQGDRTLEDIDIELKPLDKNVLKKPHKGKKVTREEYQAIVSEKLKEMGYQVLGFHHLPEGDLSDEHPNMFWPFGQHILDAQFCLQVTEAGGMFGQVQQQFPAF